MSYCGNCGAQTQGGQSFCASCGAPVAEESSAAKTKMNEAAADSPAMHQSTEAALQKLATQEVQSPPPAKASSKKILTAVLAVSFVGAIAAVAGFVHVKYDEKQHANAAPDNSGKSDTHKGTSEADSGDPGKTNPGNNSDGASGGDSGNPLADVLNKLKGGDGARRRPATWPRTSWKT